MEASDSNIGISRSQRNMLALNSFSTAQPRTLALAGRPLPVGYRHHDLSTKHRVNARQAYTEKLAPPLSGNFEFDLTELIAARRRDATWRNGTTGRSDLTGAVRA